MRAVPLIAVLGACGHDKLTTGFSPKVEPPGALRTGMTPDEAKHALPALTGTDELRGNVSQRVVLLAKFHTGHLAEAIAAFDARTLDRATATDAFVALWGPSAPATDHRGFAVAEWKSTDTGWRADLDCPDSCIDVRFVPYRPLTEAYFGTRCAPPKLLAAIPLGATVEAARKALPDLTEPQPIGDGRSIAHVDGGADDTLADLWFDKGAVFAFSIDLPLASTAEPLVNHAWGPGKAEHDDRGRPITVWTDGPWHCELAHREVHADTIIDAAELTFTRGATP